MSTERIDHVEESLNFLGAATIDTYGDDDRKVAIAQVHATHALVEQQRIANLIALAGPDMHESVATAALQMLTDLHKPEGKGWVTTGLQPNIATALGVHKEES